MFGRKVSIGKELYERLKRAAEAAGYSSVDEFVRHALEKAAAAVEEADSEEEVKKRLQGLGYLD
ncbi:MAG: ribbon-helix-helix protein, CopG family [Armatimonadota bacterium]